MIENPEESRCGITFCKNDPEFRCSRCKTVLYCSKAHQKLHWNTGHKVKCMTPDEKTKSDAKEEKERKESTIESKRRIFRKNFVDSYSTLKVEDYIPLTRILEESEEENLRVVRMGGDYDEEEFFNHGFSVCLSVKAFYLAGHVEAAKNKINMYVKKNRDYFSSVNSDSKGRSIKDISMQQKITYYQKKLQLISILANLSSAVGLSHHYLYSLYATHLQQIKEDHPNQVSNMYFLLGCDYAEQGFPIKAIACFNLCSRLRKDDAETCFFNIAILYFWMGKHNESIEYLNKSLHKREQIYGESSTEVAEVYMNFGAVYLAKFDYQTADYYYSRAISMIINNKGEDKTNPEYQKVSDAILILFHKLCSYLKSEPLQAEKPETYYALKESMLSNRRYPPSLIKQFRTVSLQVDANPINVYWAEQFRNKRNIMIFKQDPSTFMKIDNTEFKKIFNPQETYENETSELQKFKEKKKKVTATKQKEEFSFKMSDKLMSLLNSEQLMLAVSVQEKLSYIMTVEKALQEIERSPFVESLTRSQYEMFKKDNKGFYPKESEKSPVLTRRLSTISHTHHESQEDITMKEMKAEMKRRREKKDVKIVKSFIDSNH